MKKSQARIDAAAKGLPTYTPEKPCAKGHMLRSTAGGACLACRQAAEKRRYAADPEKTKAKIARKYAANAEKLRAKRRAAYAANREAEKAVARIRSAEWRAKNPNHPGTGAAKVAWKKRYPWKVLAATIARRLAKAQRTPRWITDDDVWMLEQAYELAAIRTRMFGFSWHVDHVLPLQGTHVSGLHVPNNVQVIPGLENVRKANKYLPA